MSADAGAQLLRAFVEGDSSKAGAGKLLDEVDKVRFVFGLQAVLDQLSEKTKNGE